MISQDQVVANASPLRVAAPQRRAIFLDRDGVLNVNRKDYVKTWQEFIFLPRTFAALAKIASSDFVIVVVTNQSAVNRRQMTQADLDDIHARMLAEIRRAGGRIDAIYFCPHDPAENCACRKPKTEMHRQAVREFGIDAARSYGIGDAREDVIAAQSIGAGAILVQSGRGAEQRGKLLAERNSNFQTANDLLDAVNWIWEREKLEK
ncbi:MAG: HAD family hydrolase [Chloroflexi bacterium]|nr:HAD family hydrolase [Chloroflexota bacterium]